MSSPRDRYQIRPFIDPSPQATDKTTSTHDVGGTMESEAPQCGICGLPLYTARPPTVNGEPVHRGCWRGRRAC